MSRSLGVLTLDLIARTGGFEQGMDRASRRVRTTAQDMEAAQRTADRYIMSIGAAGVAFASAAAAMAVNAAKSMDATAKMAQQIGTTTEALTGMRFAAQQFANVSDQQFDMAMRRMTRRIAEAAEGSGAAKGALEAMGLSARQLAQLAPEKQMLAIADAMQRTERQADRLRYTMAIFDTEGMPLVAALQQGAAAFEANIALAKQFGVVVSQEAAQAAEQFTSNMSLLNEAQKGFKNQVAESVLPVLADFTGHLVELSKNAGDMADRVETALTVVGVAAAGTATIITSRLIASIAKKAAAWTTATVAAARHQAQMVSLSAAIAGANRAVTASAATAAAAATTLGRSGQLLLGVLGGGWGLAATAAITGAAFLAMGRDSKTAATDVDELTRSLENLSRRQLESAAFNLENELVELSKQAEGHSQILQGLRNDYDALSKSQGVTEGELRNVRQAIREEEEAFESVIATIAKKSPLLAQITQRLWDLDTASRGAAGGVDTLNRAMGFSEAGEKYLAQIQGRIKALQDAGDPIKIASRYIAEHTELTEADRVAIMSAAHAEKALIAARDAAAKATKAGTKATDEGKRAAEAFRKEQERALVAQYQSISAIHAQAQGVEDQVALFGQSKTALEDLTIARLEEEAVVLRMYGDRSKDAVEAIEREIEARKRLRTAIGSLEQKEAERQQWEEWARDVEQIFNRVGQSLTDAIFDGGKSGKELLRDMFKSLTFNVLINPVVGAMQGWVTNQLGGMFGVQNPQQGGVLGTAQNLYSGYNAITGGLNSTFGNAAQWLGQKVGSEALTSFGLGLSGTTAATGIASIGAGLGASLGTSIGTSAAAMTTTTFSAAMGGGALIPGLGVGAAGGGVGAGIGAAGAAAGGAAGFGAAVGAALPWIGGALAIGSLLGGGLFDREPTTRREQRTQVEYAGGLFDVTKTDDRAPAGADAAARALAEQAVKTANEIFKQVGVDAAIDSFHAIMASSYKRDRDGVASGGQLRIGDELRKFGIDLNDPNPTIQGFGGWSSVDPMQRIGTEIQLSMLEAFQAVSDILPSALANMLADVDVRGLDEAGAADLVARFTAVTEGASAFLAAIETMPFAELRDLTFDAAANMVQFAGGLENLLTAQQTYYERFYSDAERHERAVSQLTDALADVGVEMPALVGSTDDMLASYRALVESLDLNTEAGQQAYVTLMQTAGAFADVAEFAGKAAAELERAAEEQRRLDEQEAARRAAEIQRRVSAERADVIAARRAAEQAEREAFEAAVKSYEEGAKAFDELRQSLLSAGDAAGLLGATIERALSNPSGKYMAGGVEYDQPRWGADTTAAGFNYDWAVMQMRLARDLSDDISANALRIENAGAALRDLSPNLGRYSEVVGPMAQALTNAVVEASGDMGYAVRDSVYEAMLGVAQRDVYSQFASQGPGLADIRYAQQQAQWASQVSTTPGFGWQYGADVGAYAKALDRLTGRMQSGQITADQFDAAVAKLNETMPTAAELLGDTEAQLERMAAAAQRVAEAGARSIDHYFGQLRQMAQELEKTEEPINKATAAIGRMNSWVSAFGESAAAAGSFSARTGDASLVAQAAGIAASVLTTADARKAAEALAKDAAFAGVGGAELRDMALLVDGIRAFDPDSWERAFIRISDALGTGAINQEQYAALFNYSLDVFEDTARTTQQLQDSFNRLRDAAKSLADDLLLDRDLTTLSFGQQYAEAQRQFEDVMRRAMRGDVDAAADLDRVTRNFLERSADSRDEIQHRRNLAVAVNNLRQIEQSNPVVDEIKRLNREIEGLRAELREANATVASNTNETTRELRRINATGIKVQA